MGRIVATVLIPALLLLAGAVYWRWWPLAKEKGVKCVINPDAHGVEKLPELWFGVGVARKGWLTKCDVMNCLPLGKIETALAQKRRA